MPVDPEAIAPDVARALAAAGIDIRDAEARQAVVRVLTGARADLRLSAAEKARAALELRQAGASYEAIAEMVGWKSKGAAHKAVMKALQETKAEDVAELRALELRRLDSLLEGGLYRRARQGDVGAVDRVLRIMEARRRYVPGLEVPHREEFAGEIRGAIIVELNVPEPDMTGTPVMQEGAARAIVEAQARLKEAAPAVSDGDPG
jgi:SOS-response transcriptional repressor LexA